MISHTYIAPDGNDHMMAEEQEWLGIVSDSDPVKGMLLVFIQKLCSAFHELAPALENGTILESRIGYVADRLAARTNAVIERLRLNGFSDLDGARDLVDLKKRLEASPGRHDIIALSEEVHLINHRLCAALLGTGES